MKLFGKGKNRSRGSQLQNTPSGVIPAKAGVQNFFKILDSRFRGNDNFGILQLPRGFTLIEVIAVLAIIGILIAVAVSRATLSGNELITERDLLRANLRYTQFKALSNNEDAVTNWGIRFNGGAYTLQKNGAAATVNFPSGNSSTHSMDGGVTVTAPASVAFNFWGSPGTADITVTLAQGGRTASITITRTTGFIE